MGADTGATTSPSGLRGGPRTHALGRAAWPYKGGAGVARGCRRRAEPWPVSGGAGGATVTSNGHFLSYPSSSSSSSRSLPPSLLRGRGEKGRHGVEPAPPAELRTSAPGPQEKLPRSSRGIPRSHRLPLSRCRPLAVPSGGLTLLSDRGDGPWAGFCPGQCPRRPPPRPAPGPQSCSGPARPQSWVLSPSLRRGVK